jgi:hypothetical protein
VTVADLITAVLSYSDNVSATDAGNTSRRARLLQYAQETIEYVWNYRPWRFIYKSGTITLASDGTGIFPADFGQIGWKGGIFLSNGDLMTEEIDSQGLYGRFLRGERNTIDYALMGFDTTTSKGKIQTLQVTGTLTILYCKDVPTLVDSSNPATGIIPIPVSYHNTVLLPGMIAKTKTSKGDVRDFYKDFLQGLELMCHKESPMQGTAQAIPVARFGW